MHLWKVALLGLASGALLRKAPRPTGTAPQLPRVLSTTNKAALNDAVLGGLMAALREGPGPCAEYVNQTLRSLELAYTVVQVPHVLEQVCNGGTFFHAFEDAQSCHKTTEALVAAYDKAAPGGYEGWCKDLEAELGGNKGPAGCECLGIPETIPRNGSTVLAASGASYAETYGSSCKTHDLALAGCDGEYKPAYCYESWCYVDKACEAKDVKSSFFFGKRAELYYSYQTCGSVDAYAAEACAGQEEASCADFSDNCAWNKPSGSCQSKLCQCTGTNNGMDEAKLGFLEGYGESCQAWDEKSCDGWKDQGDGYELGLWCCKSFCYVEEGCPSGEASVSAPGLFYSYFACPDVEEKLQQCPWKEPIEFGGAPLALSSDAAAAMNEVAK